MPGKRRPHWRRRPNWVRTIPRCGRRVILSPYLDRKRNRGRRRTRTSPTFRRSKAFEAIEDESEPTPTSTSADFQSFVESIEPDREDAQVLLQLAELAMEGGDPQMALLRYEQALEKAPRNADAWTGRGVALQHLE